ncbi:hypothetical protein RBI14_22375 [Alcaligenaceae bacterium B3P038]|nr:hypothetical protein [Alcaligenaceae bacterium B3P038]
MSTNDEPQLNERRAQLSPTILLAALPFVGTAAIYSFEYGFLRAHGISSDFIELSISRIVASTMPILVLALIIERFARAILDAFREWGRLGWACIVFVYAFVVIAVQIAFSMGVLAAAVSVLVFILILISIAFCSILAMSDKTSDYNRLGFFLFIVAMTMLLCVPTGHAVAQLSESQTVKLSKCGETKVLIRRYGEVLLLRNNYEIPSNNASREAFSVEKLGENPSFRYTTLDLDAISFLKTFVGPCPTFAMFTNDR